MPPEPSNKDSSDSSSGFSGPNDDPLPDPAVVIPIAGAPALPLAPLAPALPLNNAEPNPEQNEAMHRHAGDPAVADLLDNLDASEADKQLLRQYYQAQANMSTISARTKMHRRRIDELEQLVRSSDPVVRQRAEYELDLALEQLKVDKQEFEDNRKLVSFNDDDDRTWSKSNSSVHSASDLSALNPDELPSFDVHDEEELLPQNINVDFEPEQLSPVRRPNPDINIRTPNLSVTISHSTPVNRSEDNPFARRPALGRTPPNPAQDARIRDWVSGVSPHHGAHPHRPWSGTEGAEAQSPVTTRRGRVVKPVIPFDAAAESLRQRQSRDLERAIKASKDAVKQKSKAATDVEKETSVRKPSQDPAPVSEGASGPRPTTVPPSQPDDPFARSSRMPRSPVASTSKAGTSKPPIPPLDDDPNW